MINWSTGFLSMLRFRPLAKNNKLKAYTVSPYLKCGAGGIGVFVFTFILTGCVAKNGQSPLETLAQVVVPEVKVTDYRYTSCESIWNDDKPESQENALFWLRMMDCADRTEAAQARADAAKIEVKNWADVFSQNILLSTADPSAAERRKMLDTINAYSLSFPNSVRPLLQLWREQQVQMINLADAGARYKRLQQEMDTKLDRLKEDNAKLAFEVKTISRKLENLTDIERQLSSRKKSTNETEKEVENSVEGDKSASTLEQKPAEAVAPEATPNQTESESK